MKLLSVGAIGVVLTVASVSVLGQPKYADPWDPAVEAAAERAVAALKARTSLEIRATILTIPDLIARGN